MQLLQVTTIQLYIQTIVFYLLIPVWILGLLQWTMSTFIGDAVKQNLSFTAWFYDCQNSPFYRDILVATFGQAKYSGALPSSWPPPGALHPGLCWGLRPHTPVMGSRSPQDPTLCSSKLTFNKSWPPINEGDLWVWVTRATWFAWTNSRHISAPVAYLRGGGHLAMAPPPLAWTQKIFEKAVCL